VRFNSSSWRGLTGKPDYSFHVVHQVGQADLGSRAGKADGTDTKAHWALLAGEDVLDRCAYGGLAAIGTGGASTPEPSTIDLLRPCTRWRGRLSAAARAVPDAIAGAIP
jgi:hypothetical protein